MKMKNGMFSFVVMAFFAMAFSTISACADGQGINTPATSVAGLNADGTGPADNCEAVYNPPSVRLGKSCVVVADCNSVAPLLKSGASAPVFCVTQNEVDDFGWSQVLVGQCVAQLDTDGDAAGDECDDDDDGDLIKDAVDNCPLVTNHDQLNTDHDGLGDACDPDDDNDGILDGVDNCPLVENANQLDTNTDGVGDACEDDSDGDGILNNTDNCPFVANVDQLNSDDDLMGDACDPDDDNDGILDAADNCPLVANANQLDTDGDSFGDVCDPDIDGDTVLNGVDNCPNVANFDQSDLDNDSFGDVCDPDCDGDGTVAPCNADSDGDGFIPPADCMEGEASVHPGATELCNGVDDDCDGVTDDGCPAPACVTATECDDGIATNTDTCVSGVCVHTPLPPAGTCLVNADCLSTEACIAGICRLKAAPGQCSPFAVTVKGMTTPSVKKAYLEWYTTSANPAPTRNGVVEDGTYQSFAGECSVIAFDFAVGECGCHTAFGDSPCKELPDSPGLVGCRHNQ